MRRFVAAAAALGLLMVTGAAAAPVREHRVPVRHGAPCAWHHGKPVLFTVKDAARAGESAWAGTDTPSRRDWRALLFFARCQRNPRASSFVHAMYRGFAKANARRRFEADWHNWPQQVASWYSDGGGTACGFHAYYGVANRDLPCGTHVDFAYNGHVVRDAIVDDRGPFVAGRDWDLNQNIVATLGFDGVHRVYVRVH